MKNQNQYENLKGKSYEKYENLGWNLLGLAYVASMIAALAAGTINSSQDSKSIEKWIKPSVGVSNAQVSNAQVSNVETIAQDK